MLIRRAELADRRLHDVRLADGRICEIGRLRPRAGEAVIDARGGALVPGLIDHHLHLCALAASMASLRCGPPEVCGAEELSARLRSAATSGSGWIRGIGYHDSVAGPIDRAWLDARVWHSPVRIQHRSGQLWVLNSRAIDIVRSHAIKTVRGAKGTSGTDHERAADAFATGRFFWLDGWLRERIPSTRPSLAAVGAQLASFGVTSVADMTPDNDDAALAHFAAEQDSGALPQRVLAAGRLEISAATPGARLTRGPTKIHLRESALPDFESVVGVVVASHAQRRAVAIHCTTRTEMVFALAALEEANPFRGDRIEHASIMPPESLSLAKRLGLAVVTQPNFVFERGDAYLVDVEAEDQAWLYPVASLLANGVPVTGGTDTPFGDADPWLAMRAAVHRCTAAGRLLGASEIVTPEAALALFTAPLGGQGRPPPIEAGAAADLCLLRAPWAEARRQLSASLVAATIRDGEIIHASSGVIS